MNVPLSNYVMCRCRDPQLAVVGADNGDISSAHDVVDQMNETWPQVQGSSTMEPAHRALVTAHMDSVPLFQPKKPGSMARTFVRRNPQ